MPQCIQCVNWNLRATDSSMARHGHAVRNVHSKVKWKTYSATFSHECKEFEAVEAESVEARRRFIDKPSKGIV